MHLLWRLCTLPALAFVCVTFGLQQLLSSARSKPDCFPNVNHKRDTLIVPITILPEPDGPLVYVPAGGLVKAVEDSDVVLKGLEIVEKDGVYKEGEMEGEYAFQDSNETMDIVSTRGRSWQGKVQFRNGAAKKNMTSPRQSVL